MSFRGDISTLSLSDLVQNLAANQKTGELRILSGNSEWYILFRDGKVVSYSDNQGFSISEWLVEKDVLRRSQLDEALRRYRKAKRKSLGEIVRDLGLLDLDVYKTYLSNLVEETLYEVLSFEEGGFEFVEGQTDVSPAHRESLAMGLEFAAPNLVMEAARRSDDWHNIRRHIPSESEIYVVPPANRERLLDDAANDLTREAVELLDGTRTLRQVIAKLPYSRFDCCKCLAEFIAEKKIRPMDGSVLTQFSRGDEDPQQVIACLRTIHEREPNNREILQRLAELLAEVGQHGESSTYSKLLAISYLDEGDLENAEKSLRRSLELNPKDIVSWQKLLDTIRRQENRQKLAAFAAEYTEHFRALGLMEVVRNHLVEIVKLFPNHLQFRLDLADARYALGEHKAGVDDLMALGVDRIRKNRLDDAEKVFGRVIKYDREHRKARQLLEKIRSGKIAQKKAFRRRASRIVALSAVLLALSGFVVYDHHARSELLRITGEVYAESLLESGRHQEAISRIAVIRERHRFSTASRDARWLLDALQKKLPGTPEEPESEKPSERVKGEVNARQRPFGVHR